MPNHRLRLSTILNKPLALDANRTAELRSELIAHGPHAALAAEGPHANSAFESRQDDWFYGGVPLRLAGSVAIIAISGILLSGPGGYGYPYLSFYEDIRARLDDALDNPHIQAVALWIDSPGGVVGQCFELSDHIAQARTRKPIVSIVYDTAASAAYALACAADTLTVPPTGIVGSIGVIMIHADYSVMLNKAGVTTTIFRYGAHKAELQDTEPLTPDVITREQSLIDALGERFVALVARNRALNEGTIRATQAEIYLGERGVEHGLADSVLPPHEALNALVEQFS